MLNLVVVEGEGQINNIKQRSAREPVVQVQDENHKPVAGAIAERVRDARAAGPCLPGVSPKLRRSFSPRFSASPP